MASIRDNLSYIPVRLGEELSKRREEFALKFEYAIRQRIRRGEGMGTHSTRPTWFNTERIPGFRGRFDTYRRAKPPRRRSRFGYVSIWLDQGYAEYKGIIRGEGGPHVAPVDLNLTGTLMDNFRVRATRMAGGGLHAWINFRRQRRPYGRLTNRQLAEVLNERYALKPFWLTEGEAQSIFNEIIDSTLVSSGAQ